MKKKAALLKYKDKLATASSYKEFLDLWLSRKEPDQYMNMMEELAYIRFLTNTSDEFYKMESCYVMVN